MNSTSDFIKTIDYYAKSFREKVLPSFDDISEEANKVRDETYTDMVTTSWVIVIFGEAC
jgi:hypothetical protein